MYQFILEYLNYQLPPLPKVQSEVTFNFQFTTILCFSVPLLLTFQFVPISCAELPPPSKVIYVNNAAVL